MVISETWNFSRGILQISEFLKIINKNEKEKKNKKLVVGQYEKNFDINLQGDSDNGLICPFGCPFLNGLICDLIMSSCLTKIENMKDGSFNVWKSLSFR